MASFFQGYSGANTFSLRAPATTLSPENGHLVFNGLLTLRGAPLVDFLDFLNVHFDSIRRILHPDSVDGPEAAVFPDQNYYEVLRDDIIALLNEILGPRAFELFFQPQSVQAGELWDSLMSGVHEKTVNSEDHARWSKLNPNKTYALLPGSGLNYSFAQPGHAEANIGYGVPEWMVRAKQRSPELQSRATFGDKMPICRHIEERSPGSNNDGEDDEEIIDWAQYLRDLREEIRPSLRERHPTQGNTRRDSVGFIDAINHFTFQAVLAGRVGQQRAHSFDLHTPSRSAQDPRDRQSGYQASTGLLFGHSIPSSVIDIPNQAKLLGHIHDVYLKYESKAWPSVEADQYQARFAYGSTTLSGAKSYLAEMSKVPRAAFEVVEDITYHMAYRYLQKQMRGPIHQESTVNYLISLTNLSIAVERFSRDSRGPEDMENILENTRNSLWKVLGIQECSPEQTSPRPKKMSWAKECHVILNGLHKAHTEFEKYSLDGQGPNIGQFIHSRKHMPNEQSGSRSCQPQRTMVFFR